MIARPYILAATAVYVLTVALAVFFVWASFVWAEGHCAELEDEIAYQKRHIEALSSGGHWVRKYNPENGQSSYTFKPSPPAWQGPPLHPMRLAKGGAK